MYRKQVNIYCYNMSLWLNRKLYNFVCKTIRSDMCTYLTEIKYQRILSEAYSNGQTLFMMQINVTIHFSP